MAKKKGNPAAITVIVDDTIDERAMTKEEREKAVESLTNTVAEQANAIKNAAILAQSLNRLADEGQEAEQIEMQLDMPGETNKKEDAAEPKSISLARKRGAITSLGGHVATLANKDLQYSFTSFAMMGLPGEWQDFLFTKEGLLLDYSLNGQELQPLDTIQTTACMAFLQMASICDIREYNSKDNPSLSIHLPSFFRELHIDPRPHEWETDEETGKKKHAKRTKTDEQTLKHERLHWFMDLLKPLANRVGIIKGEGYYTIAQFLSWDESSDTAYIAVPYEIKLVELARLHSDRHSAISTIFRADIFTENQAAVELANRIAVGVIERGVTRSQADTYKSSKPRKPSKTIITKTDEKGRKETTTKIYPVDESEKTTTEPQPRIFRYEARFDTLISDCPQLQSELRTIKNNSEKNIPQKINKKLKDTFFAAIRIIMEKSEMPRYYADLSIRSGNLPYFKAPTNSTLRETIVVTHKGKNPNYTG